MALQYFIIDIDHYLINLQVWTRGLCTIFHYYVNSALMGPADEIFVHILFLVP